MKLRNKVLTTLLFLILTSCIISVQSRQDWSFESGKAPDSFCTSHIYEEISLNGDNTNYSPTLTTDQSNGFSILLTKEAVSNSVGWIWYKKYQDWQNGFVASFNIDISNPTCKYRELSECEANSAGSCDWKAYDKVETRCGADGFAFVIQSSSEDATGQYGGGLGYKKLSNVIAIEFDTWYNEDLNDPLSNIERHISVIVKKGQAEANEADSIIWNDKPLNFKNNRSEGFLVNPRIRIEYLNKNLRVFINDVLQIGYYNPFDLQQALGLSNSKFYLGLTASTSSYSQNVKLSQWIIQFVRPSPSKSIAKTRDSNPKANEPFTVELYVKDDCGNRYVPIDSHDSLDDISWRSVENCKFMSQKEGSEKGFSQTGPTYLLSFICSKIGSQSLTILYKKKEVSNAVAVEIQSNVMTALQNDLKTNSQGPVGKPFTFTVLPLDSGDNIAKTTKEAILDQVVVTWPNPQNTRKDHVIVEKDGSYTFSINVDELGDYIISSQLFKRINVKGSYIVNIFVGEPDSKNTIGTIYNNSDPTIMNPEILNSGKVIAGTQAYLKVDYRDASNNIIKDQDLLDKNLVFAKVENGIRNDLSGPKHDKINFELNTKGQTEIKIFYNETEMNCPSCFFTVLPSSSLFSNASLYQYSDSQTKFVPVENNKFSLKKADPFLFLLVLKDEFGNELDSVDKSNYKANLSGNFMNTIDLELTPFANGLKISVQSNDQAAYLNLVGKPGYVITVQELKPKIAQKTYSLTIISDGSDSDGGNGDYVPFMTKIAWVTPLLSNKFCLVGQTYTGSIQLVTKQGLRYNNWLDDILIKPALDKYYSEKGETLKIRRNSKPGEYLVDFVVTVGTGVMRTLSFNINGIPVNSKLKFFDKADQAFAGFLDVVRNSTTNELDNGLVLSPYTFTLTLRDRFGNLAEPSNSLDLVFKQDGQAAITPQCPKNSVGSYKCSFTPAFSGILKLTSGFFQNDNRAVPYYLLKIAKGDPDSKMTEASIVNDVSSPLVAGTIVNFKLVVRDQLGTNLEKKEVAQYINKFGLVFMYNDYNEAKNIELKENSINDKGEIVASVQVTQIGSYKFLPTFQSENVKCMICALSVEADKIDTSKIVVKMLQSDTTKTLIDGAVLFLDNNKVVPSFIMEFFDQYGNKRGLESEFVNYKGLLDVPVSLGPYKFFSQQLQQNVLFTLDSNETERDRFRTEFPNNDCSLSLSADNLNNDGRKIDKKYGVILKGNDSDRQYSKKEPTQAIIIPSKVEVEAGQYVSVTVELRTAEGLIYFDEINKGFYSDDLKIPFKLNVEQTQNDLELQVSRGKLSGTYVLTFMPIVALESNVTLQFAIPNDTLKYKSGGHMLLLTVTPSKPNYLVINDLSTVSTQCQANTKKTIKSQVYDRFKNLINNPDTAALGLLFHSESEDILPQISLGSGIVSATLFCKKAGLVTFKSIQFLENKNYKLGYDFNIVADIPDPSQSFAELISDSISAGETAIWRVVLIDLFGNTVNNCDNCKNDIQSYVSYNGESSEMLDEPKYSDLGSIISYSDKYIVAGAYKYQSFYKQVLIRSSKNVLKVNPLSANWLNSKLAFLNKNTGIYEENKDFKTSPWIQPSDNYPEFQVNLYDKYDNKIDQVPSDWSLGLFLSRFDLDDMIGFCLKSNSLNRFIMCTDNTNQPKNTELPAIRWANLTTNDIYDLNVTNNGVQGVNGLMNITSNETDDGTSNLDIDINNTVIIPNTPLITTAGVEIRFNVELRTTNKEFRPNFWFVNPSGNLSLTPKVGQIETVVSKGDKKGQYVFTIKSNTSYSVQNPNILTLYVNGQEFKGHYPSLIVHPGDIDRIVAYDPETQGEILQMPAGSVDNLYKTSFFAYDSWDNIRPITVEDYLLLSLQNSKNETINFAKNVNNGKVNAEFQPKYPDTYRWTTKSNVYEIIVSQGEVSTVNSFGTVNITSDIKAGSTVQITVSFKDKWGNDITLSQKIIDDLNTKYYFKTPEIDNWILGEDALSLEKSGIVFEQIVTIKGVYKFKVSIKDQEIQMIKSIVNVIPGDISLKNSLFSYFDASKNTYVLYKTNGTIEEDNIKVLPKYLLKLSDKYSNVFDEFPKDSLGNFTTILTGNDLITNGVINYKSDSLIGNSLAITLIGANIERYTAQVHRKDPYILEITYNEEKISFPINLMGEGNKDDHAEGEVELDLNNTFFSKNSLTFVAGESDNFIIELRTKNNKRKSDVKNIEFTFEFLQADGLNDGNFNAFAIDSDLRGTYLITVNGTKSNIYTKPTILSISVKNILVPKTKIPSTVSVTVKPSKLKSIEIPTQMINSTTDKDYIFEIIPYDRYNNLVDVNEPDVNLEIEAPNGKIINEYSTKKDTNTLRIQYTLKPNQVGIYIIKSSLLSESKRFRIFSGIPSAQYTIVKIDKTSLIVGEIAKITITAYDAYNNRISLKENANLLEYFTANIELSNLVKTPSFNIDSKNDVLTSEFSYTKSGIAHVTVNYKLENIPCDSCAVSFKAGSLNLQQTKYIMNQAGIGVVEVSSFQVGYGSRKLAFIANLYDTYSNPIESFNETENFVMTINQAEMDEPLDFEVKKNQNFLLISLQNNDEEAFSRLVPGKDYQITLKYLVNKLEIDNLVSELEIVGTNDGAGNGKWETAIVRPFFLELVAGVQGFSNVDLLTLKQKRFNGKFDLSKISGRQIPDDTNTPHLTINFYEGNVNGRFMIGYYSKKSSEVNKTIKVQISHNGVDIGQDIFIDIIPNTPNVEKTKIIRNLNASVPTDQNQTISLQFFDDYDNIYSDPLLVRNLKAVTTQGNAKIYKPVAKPDHIYEFIITPSYPPRVLSIMIQYKLANASIIVPVFSKPLNTIVTTQLDPFKTELVGSKLSSFAVDEALEFNVLLKDNKGYCFEGERNIFVLVTGPYIDGIIDPVTSFNEKQVASITTIQDSNNGCNKIYKVAYPQANFTKIGYYRIDTFIEGENLNQPVKSINNTLVTAGPIHYNNTVISVPSLLKRGRAPLNLEVNTSIVYHVQSYDEYKNIITRNGTENGKIVIKGLDEKQDYSINFENNHNGSYEITLTVKKTGNVSQLQLLIDEVPISWEEITRIDVPDVLVITPGPCAVDYPVIDNQIFTKSNVTVGELGSFKLHCRDRFNNKLNTGGAIFHTIMVGNNLDTVNVDYPFTKIIDNNDGSYTYQFRVSWAGIYNVILQLEGIPYGESFEVKASRSKCSQGKNTTLCVDSGLCVENFRDCNYPFICKDNLVNPYKCPNGECKKDHLSCQCGSEQDKCVSTRKCVDIILLDMVCSTQVYQSCPSEYNTNCEKMQSECRLTQDECPSDLGCPAGYVLCADQTCALLHNNGTDQCPSIKEATYCDFPNPYRCDDYSCVEDPRLCPTRVTCRSEDWVVCPDRTCAKTEFECRPPVKCDEGLVLCPDQSCRLNKDQCPQRITCSIGLALCEDNTCRASCKGIVKPASGRILSRLTAEKTNNTCPTDYIVCPGGECVTNYFLCPTVKSCPKGSYLCPDYSCAQTSEKCIIKSCDSGKTLCWDGRCVENEDQCPTSSTCPSPYINKCPDGSCVENANQCHQDIKCPVYAPYKCGTGECRADSSECPTLITCPRNRPILCPDGTCVSGPQHCLKTVPLIICNKDQTLCPDGSCAASRILCPTIPTCPAGQIRCWDNSCAPTLDQCEILENGQEVCSSDKPLRCPDGSCRATLRDCPTRLICPFDRPIRCDDGTCRQSVKQCAINSECNYGLKRCPDGSCTLKICGDDITCSTKAPYKCFDGTCKIDPRDCPITPKCSIQAPILCPDGTCVSQRVNCKRLDSCADPKNPVRCPDMKCYPSSVSCEPINGCPVGKEMCEDGSCARHPSYCPTKLCPDHLPHKCSDGFCVNDPIFCDSNSTACPYNNPIKCWNGKCVSSELLCPNKTEKGCPVGLNLCPDGSCSNTCPNKAGCPNESPLRCATGECINPNKTSCPVATCPKETPIKCLDGLCSSSITYCPSLLSAIDYLQCKNEGINLVPCADGRCVPSADLCRPLFRCPGNQVRCGDGSCRAIQSLCPLVENTCPTQRKHRCQIGACVAVEEECPFKGNNCPNNAPVKCPNSGLCAKNNNECNVIDSKTYLLNECTRKEPIKCSDGSCKSDISLCPVKKECSTESPIRCPSGFCVKNVTDCKNIRCNNTDLKYTCDDGSCAKKRSDCVAQNKCPFDKPFLCSDGNCKSAPSIVNGEKDGCWPNIVCPKYKPVLCGNGECQGDAAHCRIQKPCPENRPYRCQDQTCAEKSTDCKPSSICPVTAPVLCGNGLCVLSPIECVSTNNMFCPKEKPIQCANKMCVKRYLDCVDSELHSGENHNKLGRILVNDPLEEFVVCSDGSYRKSLSNCLIIPPCEPGLIRCQSGYCVSNKRQCENIEDKSLVQCVNNTTRCADGVCRKDCINYQGCQGEFNFHCANGYCARNEGECAGDSVCPKSGYRCIDNTCVSDQSKCNIPLRSYPAELLQITASALTTTVIEFIQKGSSSIKLGKITLPGGALLSQEWINQKNNTSENSTRSTQDISNITEQAAEWFNKLALVIAPVAESEVRHISTNIEKSKKEYVSKIFPENDGVLYYHQTVRSPIVKLSTLNRKENETYTFPLILELSSDILSQTNKTSDYCLATINSYTKKWKCVSRELISTDNDVLSNNFAYPVNQDGVYSVIFNPEEAPAVSAKDQCDWFCQNKWTILYVFGALIIAGIAGSYIIWRISRYVNKYREAKKQMANYRDQITEMEKAKTDVLGQTLKDKIEGISFTTNPAFRKESNTNAKEREKKLEESIEKISKRDKLLEESNRELTEKNQNLLEEIDVLKSKLGKDKEYHESMDIKKIEGREFD